MFLKLSSQARRVDIFMSTMPDPKPIIFCFLLCAAYIELYEIRNPQKKTFCHMLPLVVLPIGKYQINLSNRKKPLAAYLKEIIHALCDFKQQVKYDLIPKILFSAAIKLLFVKITQNSLRGKSKWQLKRILAPKETANLSPGYAELKVTLILRSQEFFGYSQDVLYHKPKDLRLTKERGTKPVCLLLPLPLWDTKVATTLPPVESLCYATLPAHASCAKRNRERKGGAIRILVGGRVNANFYRPGCKKSQTQLWNPCIAYDCRKYRSFSFLNGAYFRVNKYSVCKDHAAVTHRKIENYGPNKRDFCYRTKAFKNKKQSIDLSVLDLAQPVTSKKRLSKEQQSLTVLRGLHLLENRIKPTKKRKSMLKLSLVTQISPINVADNKSNQPILERLVLPYPHMLAPSYGISLIQGVEVKCIHSQINIGSWYNLLFDFLPLTCYGVRFFEPQSNTVMLKRIFLFSPDLPLPLLPPTGPELHAEHIAVAKPVPIFSPPGMSSMRGSGKIALPTQGWPNLMGRKRVGSKKVRVQCIKVRQKQVTKSEEVLSVTYNIDSQKIFRTNIYPAVYRIHMVVVRIKIRQKHDGFRKTLPWLAVSYGISQIAEYIRAKHIMSMRMSMRMHSIRHKRYCIMQKRVYWLLPPPLPMVEPHVIRDSMRYGGKNSSGIVTFLNYKPLYLQLVSKIYAISSCQAIFCSHWVQTQSQVSFAKLFHPCTWVSWFATSEQVFCSLHSVRSTVRLVKNYKKGSHLLVDSAALSIQKNQINFKQYLLYLKKLISQSGNLPLPFLITKLNRSIMNWKNNLYLLTLPERSVDATLAGCFLRDSVGRNKPGSKMRMEREKIKNPINNSERSHYLSARPDFQQPTHILKVRMGVRQPYVMHDIGCMFTPLGVPLLYTVGQTRYPSTPAGPKPNAEHMTAVLTSPPPDMVSAARMRGYGSIALTTVGWPNPAGVKEVEGKKDTQLLPPTVKEGAKQDLVPYINNSYFYPFGSKLLRSNSFFFLLSLTFLVRMLPGLAKIACGCSEAKKFCLPKSPTVDLWARFLCSTKGAPVPHGLCLTLLDPISKIGKSKILYFSYPNLCQRFTFFLHLKRVKGGLGWLTYTSQANPEMIGRLKKREQVDMLPLTSCVNLSPMLKKKRLSDIFYQLTPLYATFLSYPLTKVEVYPTGESGNNTIYRELVLSLAQKDLSFFGFTYILIHDTWLNPTSYPFYAGCAKHTFPNPVHSVWLPSHCMHAGGQVQLPDVLGHIITQFHTHNPKKSVFYNNKPTYLQYCKKKQQSQYLHFYISKLLWKQVKKRHPTQSNRWLFEKYWKFIQNRPHFYAVDIKKIYFVQSFYT